jgi:16S rRNA (adenine1518-N6/adenine1519-N6)-dimethyltransferase
MRPKKSLGQNFLRDKNIIKKIIESANLNADDLVLEVGPGEGALSTLLKNRVKKVVMIEKDQVLAENMARNFQFPIFNFQTISNLPRRQAGDQNYKFQNEYGIISGDILEINLPDLIEKNNFQGYKVVANIPYYITSPIIRLFLETRYPPKEMILMVQKEVAKRICAAPGEMNILAVSVQYYAQPEFLFEVPREAFWPVPEVDSAVIRIMRNAKSETPSAEEVKNFFRVVKIGFSAKRKTLANNLSSGFHLDKKEAEELLKKSGLETKIRAQDLGVEDWRRLAGVFYSL